MTLRNHPHFLLIIWILLSGIIAYIAAAIIVGAAFRGYVVGNPVFVATLTTLVAYTGIPPSLERKDFLAVAFALILFASMALAGLLVVGTYASLARILAGPLTSVGVYPLGPDVWFPVGAAFWFASSFCLSIASCFAGTLAARLFQRGKAR
jgi:hypothetical protein